MVNPGCHLVNTGWWVAFSGSRRRRWFDRFTRNGFRHCCAFAGLQECARFNGHNWLFVDPSVIGLRIEVLTDEEMDAAINAIAQDCGHFLWVPQLPPPRPCYVPRFGAYCVSEVERLLGLPPRALRPEGLYRRLLALGAERAFEEISWHGFR
jgi:hypothetical protein